MSMTASTTSAAQTQDYERLLIVKFQNWSVYLHENQCYLGRMVIWSHRDEFVDIFMLDKCELEELATICRLLERTLDGLFGPDLYNWASYANVVRHQHVHLIPRYSRSVECLGTTFMDKRWGMNHAPSDSDFAVSEDLVEQLRLLIKSKIGGGVL